MSALGKQHSGEAASACRVVSGWWYLIVLVAALNAVLRPASNLPITPYYLLVPFLLVMLLGKDAEAVRPFLLLCIASLYAMTVGLIFGVPFTMQLTQISKYFQLVVFWLFLEWLRKVDVHALFRLFKIVDFLVIFVFVFAIVQALTGVEIPTVVNEESHLWLNTFFYTPNDGALFLCGALCLVLTVKSSNLKKLFYLSGFFVLNLRNDAKASLIAGLVIVCVWIALKICKMLQVRPILGFLGVLVCFAMVFVFVGESIFTFGLSEFNLVQLFLDPFVRIQKLEPYGLGGSIFDRTDALIYCIGAWKSTYWLGLGAGGSVYLLSLPGYELATAKSLHNAIAEMIVEFGPIAVIFLLCSLRRVFMGFVSRAPTPGQNGIMILATAAPLMSVTQSSGYISNYTFWLTVFLIWTNSKQ